MPVADLGEGSEGSWSPLFWARNEEITEGRNAGRESHPLDELESLQRHARRIFFPHVTYHEALGLANLENC